MDATSTMNNLGHRHIYEVHEDGRQFSCANSVECELWALEVEHHLNTQRGFNSQGYGFLDLTGINDEERSSLTSALFAPEASQPPAPIVNWSSSDKTESQVTWTDSNYAVNDGVNMTTLYVVHPHTVDLSSCSSGTPGPPTASSSLDSLPTTEREMAPHSPQRNTPAQTSAPPVVPPPPPPLAYSQPPPPLYPTAPANWTNNIPPNVYVGQFTANVNVHGYMGQYYPPQYTTHPSTEPRGRDGRDRGKGRRGGVKRGQSPPTAPIVYYPYYPTPQTAQGAPLYHMPISYAAHPMSYVSTGYPYVPYMEYAMMEDPNQAEKGPEEYPTELMIEQEPHVSHEMYFNPHTPCLPAAVYEPNRPLEGPYPLDQYQTSFYQVPPQPPPVHQFNVHAKNFVRQSDYKNSNNTQEIKIQENQNLGKNIYTPNNSNNTVDAHFKELKVSTNKPVSNTKQIMEKPPLPTPQVTPKPAVTTSEKIVPKHTPVEAPKPAAWTVNNSKPTENISVTNKTPSMAVTQPATEPAPVTVPTPAPVVIVASKPVVTTPSTAPTKIAKNTTPAPFVNNKTFVKSVQQVSGPTQQVVIMPQQGLPSKAPFPKHKKELPTKPPESNEQTETAPVLPPASTPAVEVKQNFGPKPIPVAIPVQSTAVITMKAPFSHTRKSSVSSAEPTAPATPAPPLAPSASDFPPPPAPRRSVEQPVTNQAVPQPATPSNKTWASLFSTSSPPEETSIQPATSNALAVNTHLVTNQRPIAKVGPFDASPLQHENSEKTSNINNTMEKNSNANSRNQKGMHNKENGPDCANSIPTHVHDPNAYRMGEFLSKYQLNHHTVSLQPRGLCNRSNYCYINAILQALIACPPFFNMLKSLPYQLKKGKSTTPIIDAMVELCGEFSPLPPGARITRPERAARNSPAATTATGENSEAAAAPVAPPVNVGPPFEPSTVLHMLRDMNNGDSFRDEGRQEDAEEFLGCLLNGLNDEMLELIKLIDPDDSKDIPVVVNGNDAGQDSEDDDEWKVMGPKNKGSIERRCLAGRTPLSDIFRGQLRSRLQRVTDTVASDATHCVQPFFTLPLDIERSNSVREALERVAGKDRLEGVTCPSKGRPVEAWQQVLLEQLPAVLLLHLKCFHSRPTDGATVKIVKTIDYPVDLKIDSKIISPKMKYSAKQRSYKLFAVVYHEGSEAEKGHYLTDVYHVGCGGWLRYDDSIVTSVTEQQVLHPRSPRTPYLLLYRRQDTMQTTRHPSSN